MEETSMTAADTVVIHVKKGVKVEVKEVEKLEGDRVFVAEAPTGLKLMIKRAEAGAVTASASKITMCG
jgi:hypothetical protein